MKLIKIKVENFKSLKNIQVRDLSDINMIFGINNSGKSNFLKFLELIFKRKEKKDFVTYQEESKNVTKAFTSQKVNFWDGFIYDVPYLFWKNDFSQNICFEVVIEVTDEELTNANNSLFSDLLKNEYFKGVQSKQFKFIGKIKGISEADSVVELESVELGIKPIYKLQESGIPIYFPDDKDILTTHTEGGFYDLITIFNDCIELIDSDRYFEIEKPSNNEVPSILTPKNLKNWLFQSFLNSRTHTEFLNLVSFLNSIEVSGNLKKSAGAKLDSFPFENIDIGFSKFGEELELMLTTKFGRLPLKNHGTGVQQLIFLFSKIFESNSKIFLIEEAELNLSIEYQEIIIHNMKSLVDSGFANQFLFTSHSDYFNRNDYSHYDVSINEKGETHIKRITKWVPKTTVANWSLFFILVLWQL